MKYLFALFAFSTLLFSSCNKDEMTTDEGCAPLAVPDYMPLTIGSYWVYEDIVVDSLGNETSLNHRDSMWVAFDSVINNETYAAIKGVYSPLSMPTSPDSIIMLLRDSSGYLVDQYGKIEFAAPNLTDTIDSGVNLTGTDTLFEWHQKMDPIVQSITVPAGTFNALDFQTTYFSHMMLAPPNPRVHHKFMAEDIGIIMESYSYASQKNTHIEKRLINYHIAN